MLGYIDGVLVKSNSCGTPIYYTGVTTLTMRVYATGGVLDDVRIYNRALGAGEIIQLYNAGR